LSYVKDPVVAEHRIWDYGAIFDYSVNELSGFQLLDIFAAILTIELIYRFYPEAFKSLGVEYRQRLLSGFPKIQQIRDLLRGCSSCRGS
jgi:hypothetical protein